MTGIEDSPSPNSAAVGVDITAGHDDAKRDDAEAKTEAKAKAKTDPPPSKK